MKVKVEKSICIHEFNINIYLKTFESNNITIYL